MIKEAMDFFLSKSQNTPVDIGAKKFSPLTYKEIKPEANPYPPPLKLQTLIGLATVISNQVDGLEPALWLMHVRDFETVDLIIKQSDTEYGRRRVLSTAACPEIDGFTFGQFHAPDKFFIGVQANFEPNTDAEYVLKIASNITSETVTTSADDKVSQSVGLRAGVHLPSAAGEVLRSRLTLIPYRTFPEAKQPESEFIFRVRQTSANTLPELALFEADGGKWKVTAMENIVGFLETLKTGVQIIK